MRFPSFFRRWLTICLLIFLLSFGAALAQDLTDGTEVLITDLNSETIVGHGQVEAGVLHLRLMERTGGFYLYFIFPSGQVSSHKGQQDAGFVGVYTDTGELINVVSVLAARGNIGLELIPVDEAELNSRNPVDPGSANSE